jgi:hypothetical protein
VPQAALPRLDTPVLQSATADHQAGAVTVAFISPPTASIVTTYQVRCRELPGTAPTVASSSPVTLTGLPRGRDLSFEVVAVNAAGPGQPSAASQPVRLGEGGVTSAVMRLTCHHDRVTIRGG